jgi:DNA replication and repair protein RecF
MALARLVLTDFRNHCDALLAPGPGLVVLTGDNGAGKTNVLEAVSLLSPGRGLRGATLSEMARTGGNGGFAVAARLAPPLPARREGSGVGAPPSAGLLWETHPSPAPPCVQGGEVEIGTGTDPRAPERRQVRINGAAASATSLSEWLSVLWLTPAMDRLFQEGAGGRRRFLDRLVLALQPGHAVHAARYEAAMRARNKLLGEAGARDEPWLSALEARMAEHGAALAAARSETVALLAERLAQAPDGPFARPGVALDGGGEDLTRELARSRERDAAAGRTLAGPHRTDLAVTHLAKGQPAVRCSTGEQKALLLSIVLAHADLVAERAGRRPVLLLDEVAAHLDPRRRAALFERLDAGGGQAWMTGTEMGLFGEVGSAASRFELHDGRIA